ncbi:MAG: hypothetical protein WCJ39_06130 [bacterium]
MIDSDVLTIKAKRGKNKRVPQHLEEVFYQTIAFYPELKENYIIVVENKFYGIQHTLRAYPPLLSLFNKTKNRVYPIVINTNKGIPISFYDLNKAQQQGIFAHEMAHIVEYAQLTSFQLVKFSFRFAFSKTFTEKMEKDVDKMAIAKGCGEYLLAQRTFFKQQSTDQAHTEYVDQLYLNPDQIQQEMKKYPDIYPNIRNNSTQNLAPKTSNRSKPFPKRKHILQTIRAFTIAIVEMMRLIYIQRMHKKDAGNP